MTGIFIIGLILFLGLGIGLFLLIGNGNGMMNPYHGHSRGPEFRRFPFHPVQAGNVPINPDNKEEVAEVYQQQLVYEEERRDYMNNFAIALIVMLSFSLFFLLVGGLVYYNYTDFPVEKLNTRILLFLLLLFIPLVLFFVGLLYAIRAFRLNVPMLSVYGYDRAYSQLGLESTILGLVKDEETKEKIHLAKLVDQFNLTLEINNRKQSSLSYAKVIFLFALISVLPLVIMIVTDYFQISA